MKKISGNKLLVKALKEEGVDTLFGYPGACTIDISDELYKQDYTKVILPRQEVALVHEADAYARSTGKVGVCLVTSGPGATNIITGLADAHYDNIPLVCFTGQVPLNLIGNDAFQEVDIAGITMPITKHNYIVKDVNILADTLRRAFAIAGSGRPGPVLVDITKDVTSNSCEFEKKEPETVHVPSRYTEEELQEALSLLRDAKKPFVYVGGGAVISGAYKEVRAFAEKMDTPVCDTLMGKGVFDGHDARYTGMIGMHGTKVSNFGVSECDLLIAMGARFSDRVVGNPKKFAEHAKILHIDIDDAEINKNIRTDVSLVGDLKEVLEKINGQLEQQQHTEWMQHIAELKASYPLNYDKTALSCPYIIEEIDRITEGEAVITTDVGQHQMWAAQYYKYSRPRTLLSSGGLGTMGYGLGACLGAKMGRPDKVCINIAGDGCFRMNMNELATASRYDIPIIQVVINNHVLGMVRQWQTLFYGKRYSQTILQDKVDFCKVAEGLGCEAIRVTKKEEVAPAIEKALRLKKPVLIDCLIPEDDKVFPMVPAGAAITEAFDALDLAAANK